MFTKLLIIYFTLGYSLICSSREVLMAFGEKLPPYIFPESNSGIEIEIVQEALLHNGHILKPEYFPMGRIPVVFKNKQVDAIMMDVGVNFEKKGFYGEAPVIYKNVLFTLKNRHLNIKTPSDLKGLIVVGFVGAGARYPEWFSEGIKAGTFKERNDQAVQSELLRTRHADVIVSDSYIFYFYASIIKKTNNMKEDLMVDEHSFTNENPQDYRPVFRDKKIRDDFNSGLEYVRLKKLDKIIYNKYLK